VQIEQMSFAHADAEIAPAKPEFQMTIEPFDIQPEAERAYWEYRVASLEVIVCELLAKNERLRGCLQTPTQQLAGEPRTSAVDGA
jgi:hypothetical protein